MLTEEDNRSKKTLFKLERKAISAEIDPLVIGGRITPDEANYALDHHPRIERLKHFPSDPPDLKDAFLEALRCRHRMPGWGGGLGQLADAISSIAVGAPDIQLAPIMEETKGTKNNGSGSSSGSAVEESFGEADDGDPMEIDG